jgi:Amino acid permease
MATSVRPNPRLDRRLGGIEYFTLGFGTMVGAGWLVVLDDFLRRGGPAGGALGFALGGLLLVPIGLTYGRLVAALPDAGGEVAYAERAFPRWVSFLTGWFVVLAYLVVCPWEAVAIGKLVARVVPGLDSVPLYVVGGQPVYMARLAVGVALAAGIGYLNYRGIRFSAALQNICTFGLLAVFALFTVLGVLKGNASNLEPAFSHPEVGGALVSVLLILQVVPYYMTGFESVAKSSEEARAGFAGSGFRRAILAAIAAGALFYATVMLVVPYVHPWPELTRVPFGTAVAFERAFGSRVIGDVILLGAVLSLFKVWNGFTAFRPSDPSRPTRGPRRGGHGADEAASVRAGPHDRTRDRVPRGLDAPRTGATAEVPGRRGGKRREWTMTEERDKPRGPIDPLEVPRFAGPSTFARLPRLDEVDRCDVAIVSPSTSTCSTRGRLRARAPRRREGSRAASSWGCCEACGD